MIIAEKAGPAERRKRVTKAMLIWLLPAVKVFIVIICDMLLVQLFTNVAPNLAHSNIYFMASPGMEPTLPEGSIVFSMSISFDTLAAGDIITYQSPTEPEQFVTHRIISIMYENGQRVFYTKGDNSSDVDILPVRTQQETQKVIYSIPAAGYVMSFAKSREGTFMLLGSPLLGLWMVKTIAKWRRENSLLPTRPQI